MKLLDLEKKGNVVRFYMGDDNLKKWWGDDWNDVPYEDNAGLVYKEFIKCVCDVAFPWWVNVFNAHQVINEGETLYTKRGYCKLHYTDTPDPFLYVIPEDNTWGRRFVIKEEFDGAPDVQKFRLGMSWDELHKVIKSIYGAGIIYHGVPK